MRVSYRGQLLPGNRRWWLAPVGALLLAACSPDWNWREIRPVDEPVVMMLPAKPASMTREINLAGTPVTMTMHGAMVQGLRFTAGWIRLPEHTAGKDHAAALAAMQTGMLQNIAGTIVHDETRSVRIVDAGGKTIGRREGRFIDARGQAQGGPVRMQGLFVASGAHLVQFVALGEPWSEAAAAHFFDSVVLRHLEGDEPPPPARQGMTGALRTG